MFLNNRKRKSYVCGFFLCECCTVWMTNAGRHFTTYQRWSHQFGNNGHLLNLVTPNNEALSTFDRGVSFSHHVASPQVESCWTLVIVSIFLYLLLDLSLCFPPHSWKDSWLLICWIPLNVQLWHILLWKLATWIYVEVASEARTFRPHKSKI